MAKRNSLLTGLTRSRELVVQERLRLTIERRAESALAQEIYRTMQDYAREAAGSKNYGAVQLRHEKETARIINGVWRASFATFGKRILDAGKKHAALTMQRKDVPVPRTEIFDAAVNDWVQAYGAQKLTEITGTTAKQAMAIINNVVAAGIDAGENEVAVGKAIRAAMAEQGAPLSQLRSRMIARTESHSASSAATHEAAKALEFPTRKEWISSTDERTRPGHLAANGTTASMDEAFIVEGEKLQYPGDPAGSAGNVVNCRCAEGIVIA